MQGELLDASVRRASEIIGGRTELVRELMGGGHALTAVVRDAVGCEFVVRTFPSGDPAVVEEVRVLERLGPLGGLAPRLVGCAAGPSDHPVIVTSKVDGEPPGPGLSPIAIAAEMARTLVKIHAIDGHGLRRAPSRPPMGDGPAATAARRQHAELERRGDVLVHYDYWCGNALWSHDTLTGVVDWSGARQGNRGIDVAWCRQDLVLLGSIEAADEFLSIYEAAGDVKVDDVRAWDLEAAGQAEDVVETWAANYEGIGRPEITGEVLRGRLNQWIGGLVD